ncbi:MAG: cell envelope integrity protein TolA [Kiritimatiellales bacterium]
MNFEKWLQAGLISLCTLALFGCAAIDSFFASRPVRNLEEVPVKNGLQSKLQENQLATTNATEVAKYEATLAEAIKKDCRAKGSEFTPAPSPGLATNTVSIPGSGYHLMLSENERTEVLGIIDRGYRYVILSEYLYFCNNGAIPPTVVKVPYSCMYNPREIMAVAKRLSGDPFFSRDGGIGNELYQRLSDAMTTPSANSWDGRGTFEEEPSGVPKQLKEEFINVYATNMEFVQKCRDAVQAEIKKGKEAEKAQKDAELAAAKQVKAKQAEERQKMVNTILAQDEAPAKARASAMKNKTVVFKSLYLGMSIEDARLILFKTLDVAKDESIIVSPEILSIETMREVIADNLILNGQAVLLGGAPLPVTANSVHNITKGNLYILLVATDSSLGRKVALANGFVEADPNGKVIKIVLGEVFVNKLFDADTMDASTFADQFVKFYNVPRMDVSSDWKSWVYMSEDGAKLSISDEKTLILEKKAGQKDLKKSFN